MGDGRGGGLQQAFPLRTGPDVQNRHPHKRRTKAGRIVSDRALTGCQRAPAITVVVPSHVALYGTRRRKAAGFCVWTDHGQASDARACIEPVSQAVLTYRLRPLSPALRPLALKKV